MKKNILLFFMFLSLLACGKKGDSSSLGKAPAKDFSASPASPESSDLPEVVGDYSPLGLSDKIIVKNGQSHVPMDFLEQELTLSFDPSTQKVIGQSVIRFKLKQNGRPYFELQSPLKSVKYNSLAVGASAITDPDGQNQSYWSVNEEMSAGSEHEVELEYELPLGRVSFSNGGVRFLTDMTDLSGKFFEYWGPVGFEEDAFALKLELKLENSTAQHAIYTNGTVAAQGPNNWQIIFPKYFSKSSFYVHFTNSTGFTVKRLVYKGLEKDIPIEVYGSDSALVNSAVTELPKLFKELEGDYGAYPHEKFLAYMNKSSGGMEYVAATITSLGSLDHELLHSWFARSIIPADGRSGWIDEAIASWRDYGYTRASTTLQRTPTNLANYSPFRKTTPKNSYVDGRALMAELDFEFSSQGGLRPVLKALYKKYKNQIMTNEEFWNFLQEHTKVEVEPFNLRYALGEAEMGDSSSKADDLSKHPTPLTEEEILRLR